MARDGARDLRNTPRRNCQSNHCTCRLASPFTFGNLLSAFTLTVGAAFGIGLPMALAIIWVCS